MKLPTFLVFLICCPILLLCIGIGMSMWLDTPYMYANDPNNPGRYGNLVITNEVKLISDGITNPTDTPHETTRKCMKWTHDNIEFASPPPRQADPDVIIESGVGLCGDYAIVVTSLLACQDVPSRIIGMYNYTKGAHVVIEVYYNDSWHMYGPTHQSYWEINGTVLSFSDLRDGSGANATLHYVPNDIPIDYYLEQEIYMYSDPAGVIGPEYPMWWPLTIDREFVVPPVGYYAAGSRHIGATYTNNFQNWTITNLTTDENYSFVIYPSEIRGTDEFILHVNETGEYRVRDTLPVYANFTAHNTTENLHIGHGHTGTEHILLMIEKYEVMESPL